MPVGIAYHTDGCAATVIIIFFIFGKNNEVKESDIKQEIYAWKIIPPLGLREPAPVDTSLLNYGQRSVPVSLGPAYAITGNLGGPGETLIYFDRQPTSEFMFKDAVAAWLPSLSTHEFSIPAYR